MIRSSFFLTALITASFSAQATVIVDARSAVNATEYSNVAVVNGAFFGTPIIAPGATSSSGTFGPGATSAFSYITNPDGATANSFADLATGSLRNYADASTAGSVVTARSRWLETVTFNNTNGSTVELDFSWRTDGSLTDLGSSHPGYHVVSSIHVSSVSTNLLPIMLKDNNPLTPSNSGGASYGYYRNGNYDPGQDFGLIPTGDPEGTWTTTFFGGNGDGGLIEGTLLLPAGIASLEIDAFLYLDCRNQVICDYDNSATFRLGALPNGLSWTSESGVFLSAVSPVPEPTSLAMLGLGMVSMLGIAVRRRYS